MGIHSIEWPDQAAGSVVTWGQKLKDQINLNVFLLGSPILELSTNSSKYFKQLIKKDWGVKRVNFRSIPEKWDVR